MAAQKTSHRRWASTALLSLVLAFGLIATACSSGSTTDSSAGASEDAAPTAQITAQPTDGTSDVSPTGPVQVSVANGTLQDVTLTNADGKLVNGQPSPDNTSWRTAEPLGYGKTYTWGGNALGTDGKQTPVSGSFTTVDPKRQVSGKLNVAEGRSYGIGMPISITFNRKITDKAAVERALHVETTPNTEGSWAWLDNDTSVHWRPKEYYQPGTKVRVHANLYGLNLGDDAYGKDDVNAEFTIGRSQIVKGNTQEHRLQVIREGEQIADYPVSYGLDSDPGRVTHSGTHVVMEKHSTYSMTNEQYNYTDVNVPWAVRISNNGEFIHGLSSSVWAQGKKNVSHGCLNLSPKNAKEYYDEVLPGDPVEISGSSQQLGSKDGDYSDWTYSWSEWQAKSALNK